MFHQPISQPILPVSQHGRRSGGCGYPQSIAWNESRRGHRHDVQIFRPECTGEKAERTLRSGTGQGSKRVAGVQPEKRLITGKGKRLCGEASPGGRFGDSDLLQAALLVNLHESRELECCGAELEDLCFDVQGKPQGKPVVNLRIVPQSRVDRVKPRQIVGEELGAAALVRPGLGKRWHVPEKVHPEPDLPDIPPKRGDDRGSDVKRTGLAVDRRWLRAGLQDEEQVGAGQRLRVRTHKSA